METNLENSNINNQNDNYLADKNKTWERKSNNKFHGNQNNRRNFRKRDNNFQDDEDSDDDEKDIADVAKKSNKENNIQNYLDESEDVMLSNSQLQKLKLNKSITSKLKNSRLRQIIKAINSAKYKKSMLENVLLEDKHFKQFTDEILDTLGFMESVKGSQTNFKIVNI